MSLEGSIKDFGLSDIFQLIHVQQKSGVMSIQNQSRRASVGFVKGMVVSAQLDNVEGMERIGDVLVRAKRITPQQLERALKIQQERGDHLGQVLVSERMLAPEDLKRALRLQTLEAVYRLFRWKEGRYTFDQQPVSYPKEYVDPISTEHILMEGVRRLDEWPYIEKKIPSLDLVFSQVPDKQGEIDQATPPTPKGAPAASEDPLADLELEPESRFSPDEITVYHAVNGTHTVSRIIELVQLGEFEVCKALANLMTAGLIVAVSQPAVSHEQESGRAARALRAGFVVALQWAGNLLLIGALSAAPGWWLWQARDRVATHLSADLRSFGIIILPHHLKGFQELVAVWKAERGAPPTSLFEPLAAYGASSWPLSDPWGKPWIYDPVTGTIVMDFNADKPP